MTRAARAAVPMRPRRVAFWALLSVPVAALLAYIGIVALAMSLADDEARHVPAGEG